MNDPQQPSEPNEERKDSATSTSTSNTDADADAPSNYAFLVHSKKTLTEDLPPRVDNKVYVRQRRRRTSREDHAVLEAEYQQNPKPDKITRASIVSRVSLGDKEVQIWFQNRRQNDRRKSKPLEPHELTSNSTPSSQDHHNTANISDQKITRPIPNIKHSGSSNKCSHDVSTDNPPTYNDSFNASFETCDDSQCGRTMLSPQFDSSQITTVSQQTQSDGNSSGTNCSYCVEEKAIDGTQQHSAGKRKRSESELRELGLIESRERRRSVGPGRPPSLRISMSFDGKAMVRNEDEKTPSPPKTRDSVRLSFSADGEAVVRTASEPSPSPSRNRISTLLARQARFGGLRRTTSAVSLGSTREGGSTEKGAFGRSRDSRTWELYCDTDARSALSSPHLGVGSESRELFSRKTTGSSRKSGEGKSHILTPRTNLPNATMASEPPQKRKKLSRTMSSLGRLESDKTTFTPFVDNPNAGTKAGGQQQQQSRKTKTTKSTYHNGDSDKENWIPGTHTPNVRRRRAHPSRPQQRVLQTVDASRREVNRKTTRPRGFKTTQPKRLNDDKENATFLSEDENGEEVRKLVTGSGANQTEDLDCVQGLLSLSQGAWR